MRSPPRIGMRLRRWLLLALAAPSLALSQPQDPLPSWNDGSAKQAILKFVDAVTREDSPTLVPRAERIAVFDNDGTLWSEQPIYFSDDGDVLGIRYDNWKLVFMEQRLQGTLGVWAEPFVRLRLPKIFNLRTDPYEFAAVTSNSYYDWYLHNAYFIYAAQAAAAMFADTFKDFPAVQRPNTFTIDDAMKKMSEGAAGAT